MCNICTHIISMWSILIKDLLCLSLLLCDGHVVTHSIVVAPTLTGSLKRKVCLVYQRIQKMMQQSKAIAFVQRHLWGFPLETDQKSISDIVLSLLFYLTSKRENSMKDILMAGLQPQETEAQCSRTHWGIMSSCCIIFSLRTVTLILINGIACKRNGQLPPCWKYPPAENGHCVQELSTVTANELRNGPREYETGIYNDC